MAQSHAELQDQVERFDLVYNTERPNQALPGRITPQQAWDATEIAEAPRPKPSAVLPPIPAPAQARHPAELPPPKDGTRAAPDVHDLLREEAQRANATPPRKFSGSIGQPGPTGTRKMEVYPNGVVNIGRTLFSLTKRMGGRTVTATWDRESIVFANTEGEVIAEYPWPPKGTAYVGIGKSRTRFAE